MWNHNKVDFTDLLASSTNQGMANPEFKKKLNKKGLEIETIKIDFYFPSYLQIIDLRFDFFLGRSFFGFWLGNTPESWIDYPEIAVDKKVFNWVCNICKRYNIEGHESRITSLAKFGYSFYTLAELVAEEETILDGIQDLVKLYNLAVNSENLSEINFVGKYKGEKANFRSSLIKSIITNSIAQSLYQYAGEGWLNFLLDKSLKKRELNVKYRSMFVFMIVFYLYHDIGLTKLNEKGDIRITKEVAQIVVELCELSKVDIKASKKWKGDVREAAPDSISINKIVKDFLKTHPELIPFLTKGGYSKVELLELENSSSEKSDKYSDLVKAQLSNK